MPSKSIRLPKLPKLLERKLYKTGQTRGADDDEIFQNRVSRNSTVLIPFTCYEQAMRALSPGETFGNGFIVLISPGVFFGGNGIEDELAKNKLKLGYNLLVFYELRHHWTTYNPDGLGWKPAENRLSPLKGNYVARVPATTAALDGTKIIRGFTSSTSKGAGIRVYEYATDLTIRKCRVQLEALFWLCRDSVETCIKTGMSQDEARARREAVLSLAEQEGLLERKALIRSRIINNKDFCICPLCLEELSGSGFFTKMEQALGREVNDLTVTQINLFHIEEVKIGLLNHRPYNIGWGHHHCNVVVKDSGIKPALKWMTDVVNKNREAGLI